MDDIVSILAKEGEPVSAARLKQTMNDRIKGLCNKVKSQTRLFKARPGTRRFSYDFYLRHKDFILTTWSRMNLEAGGKSKWVGKHVTQFFLWVKLSRQHFLPGWDSFPSNPHVLHISADPYSLLRIKLWCYPCCRQCFGSGIFSIHFGDYFSENQLRYS